MSPGGDIRPSHGGNTLLDPVGNLRHRWLIVLRLGIGTALIIPLVMMINHRADRLDDVILYMFIGFAAVIGTFYLALTILSLLNRKP
jgi:hypothetical protein